jgi:hypothetical protein
MFAFIGLILFILSPFIHAVGPWPLITLGFACIALHLLWSVALPWRRGKSK